MKKKLLAILLTVCMVLSMAPAALAAGFGDTDGHWAEGSIDRWASYGIIEGVGDGEFNPDGTMTRAQAAAIFARLLKLDAKADISKYTDVASDAWYAEYIAMCVAAGIMNGVGDNAMDPNGTLTREQMMVMLCRALGIQPEATCDKTFADSDKISDWAEGYINALVNAGIVDGVGGNTMAPADDINRASMMALLDKSIAGYADEDGETITVDEDATGVILVVADNVKVEDAPTGTIVVTGADAHDTTVNGTEITNDTVHEVPAEPATPSIPVHYCYVSTWGANGNGTHSGACICGASYTENCVLDSDKICTKCGAAYPTDADSLQAALNKGGYVKLNADVTATESLVIPEGVTVTLDLNGKSITGTVGRDADNNRVHTLVNNGTLTIKNGTLASKAENGGSAVANAAGATLILENVTLLGAPQGEHDDIAAANAAYPSYAINNWGELTVNTATIKTYHGAVATGAGGNVVLNDVTIDVGQNTTTNITSWALYAYGSADEIGKITINSGNVKMTKVEPSVNGGGYACTGDGGQITIKGGSFDKAGSENNGNGIHVKANSLVITGGTFDTDPSAYVADGYKAVEADGVWTVSKRLAGEVINTEEAQAALDNATPGTVIQLSEGVGYGTLVFRQNASSVVVDITDAGGDAAGNEHYSRYEDITIIGAEGATVDQIDFEVGWIAGSGASYVDIENLTVQGVTFSGNKLAVNLEGSKGSALGIDGLTLVDCKMKDTDGTHRFVFQQITGYKALNDKTTSEYVMTAGVKNLTITGCEVEGAYQVIESRAMENLTITDNTFKGIKARDMLITSDVTYHADVTYTGTITITGNASSGGEERFIRASLNNSNAGVVIKDNTITNYKGEDADYIKVDGANGDVTIENNTITYGSTAAAQAALDAATPGTVIRLVAGVNYGSLKFRANPEHSNTTRIDVANAYAYDYVRSIENITIIGAAGAKVDGFIFETGAKPGDWHVTMDIKNLVIDGVEFTDALTASPAGYNAPIMITTSNATIDGLTVKNCKLIGDNSKLNLVYLYGADGSKNVTLTGNTVDGIARLCELRGTENVTITGNTIKNTYEHGMLLAGSGYSGNITITGNNADGIAMRFVRMAGAGAANVVITGNIITNYKGSDADYIKVTDSAGTPTIENNTITDGTGGNREFTVTVE